MLFLEKRLKRVYLIALGGTAYCLIEIAFRGFTHISMFFTGGACFYAVSIINARLSRSVALWKRMLMGSAVITAVEFIAGCVVNLWLGLHVWDYSAMPLNLLGQVCLPFSAAWFGLSAPILALGGYIDKYKFSLRSL